MSGMIKVLDTNIVLYYLGGKLLRPLSKADYYVSVITEMELLSYPELTKKAETQIRNFLDELTIVDLKSDIKQSAIELKRKLPVKLPDAIIAATAMVLEAELLTNDLVFKKIPKLKYSQLALK